MQKIKNLASCSPLGRKSIQYGILTLLALNAISRGLLCAHTLDVDVRGPEWERAETDAKEREQDRDRAERWDKETGSGDITAADVERMN